MSWIRSPVYMITTTNQIQCFGTEGKCCLSNDKTGWWIHNLTNETRKQRAKIVLNHLKGHYTDYQDKGKFDEAEKISFVMEDIYMDYFTNRLFRWIHKKYWLKFMVKYDLD